tara:strand:- start:59 stop:613 length:555 start_codon:yes stop_codon:yes gene_type:complete
MLCRYLRNFGKVYHIHSRMPPNKLTYPIKTPKCPIGSGLFEWLGEIEIENNTLHNYTVIYIYRDPVKAIYSRFHQPKHLTNIQCDRNIKINDLVKEKKDLYKLNEFFDNYTKSNNRNYKIYCIKYEMFFDNIKKFNSILKLPDKSSLYPIKREKSNDVFNDENIIKIYKNLNLKISKMDFITIV